MSLDLQELVEFKVEFTDPTNFIYQYNDVSINNYKTIENEWDYAKILKLYKKTFFNTQIKCDNMNITSFPIRKQ